MKLPGQHKYRVSPAEQRTYNGKVYASKLESRYAGFLHAMMGHGDVVDVVEQPRLWLGVRENVYVPDFLIIGERNLCNDKAVCYYVDCKGVKTAKFRRDVKLWRAYGRLPLHIVVDDRKGGFKTDEVVEPGATSPVS